MSFTAFFIIVSNLCNVMRFLITLHFDLIMIQLSRFMKNIKRIILIVLTLILACSLFAACRNERLADPADFVQKKDGYVLLTVREDGDLNGKILGAAFSGVYFGHSNIAVSAVIYSSSSFNLNFDVRSDSITVSQLETRNKTVSAFNDIHEFISTVDLLADTQTKTSDVYRYNHARCGTKLEINEHTYNMLLIAKEMYNATNQAYNPAVYRLVDLWGFSSRIYTNMQYGQSYDRQWDLLKDNYPLPDEKYVQAFSQSDFTDFSDNSVVLSQEDGKYFVTKNVRPAVVDGEEFEQWIDLGGIAKGYVADYIDGKLREIGADCFNVDVGSSSMTFGKNYNGMSAAIGIASPFTMQTLLGVDVADAAMSTSGQYLRKYTIDGTEYSHIVDGESGKPAQTGIKLVSVTAPSDSAWAGKGDCLTTALTVMGKDKLIEFMNGYLKDNGIKVYAVYQEGDKKQILSNVDYESIAYVSGEIAEYSWNVDNVDGAFVYNSNAELIEYTPSAPIINERDYTWLLIVLGVIVLLGIAAVIVYYFVKGKRSSVTNIVNAKRDKPFKIYDIGVYVAVLLVIALLFGVFFGGEQASDGISVIRVIDLETQQVLFVCNVNRKSWNAYDGTNGWTVKVEAAENLTVTFTKQFNGEERFNKMIIDVSNGASVKMEDSLCGVHQECVRNFNAVTVPNSAIVCSPNHLKIITASK